MKDEYAERLRQIEEAKRTSEERAERERYIKAFEALGDRLYRTSDSVFGDTHKKETEWTTIDGLCKQEEFIPELRAAFQSSDARYWSGLVIEMRWTQGNYRSDSASLVELVKTATGLRLSLSAEEDMSPQRDIFPGEVLAEDDFAAPEDRKRRRDESAARDSYINSAG